MKIYTKTGDAGKTSLLGGARLSKSHIRIDAYGTVDELNAYLGLLRDQPVSDEVKKKLIRVQETLFVMGALLATEPGKSFDFTPPVSENDIDFLEKSIDEMDAQLPEMKNFILPGGHITVSHCHVARCICRRAERIVVLLSENDDVDERIIKYLNRLSDYLFVLARKLSNETGTAEIIWAPRK